jgi:hypothetical protein
MLYKLNDLFRIASSLFIFKSNVGLKARVDLELGLE